MNIERTYRLWVVDDDARLRELLNRYLTEQGFQVTVFTDGRDLDRRLDRDPPHLIVLDQMMPGESGLSICRRLRARGEQIPILMLTAKGEEDERIEGLEAGADDYLAKPFNPRELVARVNAVLRRNAVAHVPGSPISQGEVRFSEFVLDLAARQLRKGDETLVLTTGEYGVLKVLATHPNEPFTRDRLMMQARGREHDALDRAIDVQISRLRKLVEPDPSKPRYLQTVWGYGYVFVPDGVLKS